jgi:hypothetical protein
LLTGIEPGCRIHIEVTLARLYPQGNAAEALTVEE